MRSAHLRPTTRGSGGGLHHYPHGPMLRPFLIEAHPSPPNRDQNGIGQQQEAHVSFLPLHRRPQVDCEGTVLDPEGEGSLGCPVPQTR